MYFLVASCVIFVGLPPEDESTVIEPTGFESRNILLYYGNGGSDPGFWAPSRTTDFFQLQTRYNNSGCPTAYNDIWPNDLNDFRVIFLIMPGFDDDSGTFYFTSMQVNQTIEFLLNGGRLVVQGDHSGDFGVNTVNDLLTRLGVGIIQNSDNVLDDFDPPPTDISADQLTNGVSTLDMGGTGVSTLNLSGSAKSLVRDSVGYDLVAVDQISGSPPRPGADVLVYGDTQVLDDHQLLNDDGDGPYDNFVFADNIGMCVDNPPIADAGGPYTGYEGSTIIFDGSGSMDDYAIVEYKWTFDGQTVYGQNASFYFNDNWEGIVTLTVTDSAGNTDNDTAFVKILNLPPTVKNGLEEKKVKEIPVPWQRWRMGVNGVVDIIFLPDVREAVALVRDFVVLLREIPLDNLTWMETTNLKWKPIDDPAKPYILEPNGEVEYFIPTTEDDRAVLVRYSVAWASTPDVIEAHFINEAILESRSPQVIVGSLSNFDVHNDYNETINNFELELYGNIKFGHLLYGHDNVNHNIIQIDRATGHATVVGPTGFVSGASGMATSRGAVPGPGGMTFPAGTHFGLFRDNSLGLDFVVVVDVSTGTATKVVQTSRLIGGRGIAFGSDGVTLYIIEGDGSLSTIDVVTGTVSLVGNTSHAFDNIHLDPSSGFFYGISGSTLYKINPGTAVATAVLPGGLAPSFSACTLTRSPEGVWYTVNVLAKTLVTININTGTISGVIGNLGPLASGSVCGTVFELSDILYVYDPPGPPVLVPGWLGPTWYGGWGAPPLIKPLPGGVEIKWMDPGHPVIPCEWIHFGVRLGTRPDLNLTGVRAYLTQLVPAPMHLEEKKVKVIPVPWQKWRLEVNGVADIIFFDPPAMPFDKVAIVREFAVLDYEIPLDDLTWMGTEGLNWTPVDDPEKPYILALNEEVELFIPTTEDDRAVLVRYSVAWAHTPKVIEAHFVNEAILESKSPQTIVGWLSNFDVHNDYNDTIDNFELEFYGNITPSDIKKIYDPPGPPVLVPGWLGPTWYNGWGAPPQIKSIPGGIEIKWVDLDHPVQYCEWIHFGVSIDTRPDLTMTGAKAYLTQMVPELKEKKVKAIPVPWQKWRLEVNGVADIIFFDPPAMPFDEVAIVRDFVVLDYEIPLDNLTWMGTEGLNWTPVDDPKKPYILPLNEEVELFIPTTEDDRAVLVRYSVAWAHTPTVIEAHFVNEAILESRSPLAIVGWLSNFDVHNDYNDTINNFELEFYGNVVPSDILSVYDPFGPPVLVPGWLGPTWYNGWGAPPSITSIPGGIEIKWVDLDHPVQYCEWIHFGVSIDTRPDLNMTGAKAYLTQMVQVPVYTVDEGTPVTLIAYATDPGSDDLTFRWNWGDGTPDTVMTYYNNGVSPDPYPSYWYGTSPFSVTNAATHVYGDDGHYNVTLTVTDDDGGTTVSMKQVIVKNVDPTVTIDSALANAEIGLRVAGRKWNNVSMDLYEDGTLVGSVSIERLPGSPNDQMVWIPFTLDLVTKTYNATVFYIPEDPPEIGGNPVWIYVKFEDGSIAELHHTFNVQQSMIRDSDHWNHVEPWEVDINAGLVGHNITLTGTATDPGSDDLGFKWSFLATTTWYRNDGTVGTFPTDPFPSPWGTFPFSATETVTYVYSGPDTITLTVYDDDGGVGTATLSIS